MSESLTQQSSEVEHSQILTADDEHGELDEGYDGGSDTSSLTSIATQIRNGVMESGRLYADFGRSEYALPRDDIEMDRIDMVHEKYFLLLNHKRYLAPLCNPRRILDLGCGTGIWCMDIADEFPLAHVSGTDIAPIQPNFVPPNLDFCLDDANDEFTWKKDEFDFIFSRDLFTAIRDWPRLIRQCYEHLKPGGWLEFEGISVVLHCDDETLPKDGYFYQWDRLIKEAAIAFGTSLEDPSWWKQWFEAAGFEMVVEKRFKMPSNPWPQDKRMKLVGAFERENLLEGIEGMSLRLFQKALGWSSEETLVLCARVKEEVRTTRYHAYYPFYVVYGHKPELC